MLLLKLSCKVSEQLIPPASRSITGQLPRSYSVQLTLDSNCTSFSLSDSEDLVGDALKILEENHGIQRHELFLQTK